MNTAYWLNGSGEHNPGRIDATEPASFPGNLKPLASPAPLGRRYPHTKLAIRMVRQSDEHAMKACQICTWFERGRLGQSSQFRDEVQLEYEVGSAIAVRCLQLVANITVDGKRYDGFRASQASG